MNKRMKEIEARKAEIRAALQGEETVDLKALEEELNKLNEELEELKKRQEMAEKINEENEEAQDETRAIEKPKNTEVRNKMEHTFDSMEYRKAFMSYVKTGQMAEEFRAVSVVSGNAAVIPSTISNEILKKVEGFGKLLPLVKRTSYKGGYSIPVMQLTADAAWMSDADMSTTGVTPAAVTTASVTFGNYILAKEISVSFLLDNVSLDAFEAAIVDEISRAFTTALEKAIVSGTGNGQPKGVTVETPAASVTLASTPTYKDLVKIRKSIPSGYADGAVLVMNEQTFWELVGIVDNQGQPVARTTVGLDNKPNYNILGLPVVTSDAVTSLDSASAGGIVGVVMQPDKYVINSAYEMDMRIFDEPHTRNRVYSAAMIADGRMVDRNGLVFVKKG